MHRFGIKLTSFFLCMHPEVTSLFHAGFFILWVSIPLLMNIKKIYWKRANSLPENEVSVLWEMDTLLCKLFCCLAARNRLLCIINKLELELENKPLVISGF